MKEKEFIDNYRDLPLGKYLDIIRVCEQEDNEVDRKVAILAILSGKSEDDVLNLPLAKFTEYSAKAKFLERECPDNLIPSVSRSYPIGGFVLIPATDIRKITAAQYIDFKTFAEDREHNMVELLSCFLIPRGCDYADGYDIADVHRAIREELSVAECLALLAFFFRRWAGSIRDTLTYSVRLARRIKDEETRERVTMETKAALDLLKNGVGLQ